MSLEIDLSFVRERIAHQLGYNRDYSALSASEQKDIDQSVDTGTRWFYWPGTIPVQEGEASTFHQWSWLNVTALGVGTSGTDPITTNIHDLPTDFGDIIGDITYTTGGGLITQISVERLLAMRGSTGEEGQPQYFAVRTKAQATPDAQQTREILFYPDPPSAASYNVRYRYNILPPAITGVNDVPLGGIQHGETWLYSCLAAAEYIKDDGGRGEMWTMFMQRLSASVGLDNVQDAARKASTFPTTAPSTTLEINYEVLAAHYSNRMFGTWDINGLDHEQKSATDEGVQRGYRKLLFPQPVDDQPAHQWSFLRPVRTITFFPEYIPSVEYQATGSEPNVILLSSYDAPTDRTTFSILGTSGGAKVAVEMIGQYLVTDKASTSIYEILDITKAGSNATISVQGNHNEDGQFFGITDRPVEISDVGGGIKSIRTPFGESFYQSQFDGEEPFDFGDGLVFIMESFIDENTMTVSDPGNTLTATNRAGTITSAHNNDYLLPKEVNGIDGFLTHESESSGYSPVALIGEQTIRQRRSSLGLTSGMPIEAGIIAIKSDQSDQQRRKLRVWPRVDGVYHLQYRYPIIAQRLAPGQNVPYGGPAIGEMLLESVLAIAEEDLIAKGVSITQIHGPRFDSMLRAAIAQDARGHEAEHYGYNADHSDVLRPMDWGARYAINWRRNQIVTVGGQIPTV